MRNLTIAAAVFVSTATVLVVQRSALGRTRAEADTMRVEAAGLSGVVAALEKAVAELERTKERQSHELAETEEALRKAQEQRKPAPVPELTPAAEGNWPRERPYFYLAKKHIPTVDYGAFDIRGRVSSEAAVLFGMAGAERRAIDQALESVYEELRRTELAGAYLTNTPSMVEAQRSGAKISVAFTPNPNLESIKLGLMGEIVGILGSERSPLFLERAREAESQFASFSLAGRIVTIIPNDESKGEIIVSSGHGMSFTPYDLSGEVDWTRFQYEHLLREYLPAFQE
jgi:hypothetical protein